MTGEMPNLLSPEILGICWQEKDSFSATNKKYVGNRNNPDGEDRARSHSKLNPKLHRLECSFSFPIAAECIGN